MRIALPSSGRLERQGDAHSEILSAKAVREFEISSPQTIGLNGEWKIQCENHQLPTERALRRTVLVLLASIASALPGLASADRETDIEAVTQAIFERFATEDEQAEWRPLRFPNPAVNIFVAKRHAPSIKRSLASFRARLGKAAAQFSPQIMGLDSLKPSTPKIVFFLPEPEEKTGDLEAIGWGTNWTPSKLDAVTCANTRIADPDTGSVQLFAVVDEHRLSENGFEECIHSSLARFFGVKRGALGANEDQRPRNTLWSDNDYAASTIAIMSAGRTFDRSSDLRDFIHALIKDADFE